MAAFTSISVHEKTEPVIWFCTRAPLVLVAASLTTPLQDSSTLFEHLELVKCRKCTCYTNSLHSENQRSYLNELQ